MASPTVVRSGQAWRLAVFRTPFSPSLSLSRYVVPWCVRHVARFPGEDPEKSARKGKANRLGIESSADHLFQTAGDFSSG